MNCETCKNGIIEGNISATGKDFCSEICHIRFWKEEIPNLVGRFITDEDLSNLENLEEQALKNEYDRI